MNKKNQIGAPKVVQKVAPKFSQKIAAKVAPKTVQKITPKVTQKVVLKVTRKVTPKVAPEVEVCVLVEIHRSPSQLFGFKRSAIITISKLQGAQEISKARVSLGPKSLRK